LAGDVRPKFDSKIFYKINKGKKEKEKDFLAKGKSHKGLKESF